MAILLNWVWHNSFPAQHKISEVGLKKMEAHRQKLNDIKCEIGFAIQVIGILQTGISQIQKQSYIYKYYLNK